MDASGLKKRPHGTKGRRGFNKVPFTVSLWNRLLADLNSRQEADGRVEGFRLMLEKEHPTDDDPDLTG